MSIIKLEYFLLLSFICSIFRAFAVFSQVLSPICPSIVIWGTNYCPSCNLTTKNNQISSITLNFIKATGDIPIELQLSSG